MTVLDVQRCGGHKKCLNALLRQTCLLKNDNKIIKQDDFCDEYDDDDDEKYQEKYRGSVKKFAMMVVKDEK